MNNIGASVAIIVPVYNAGHKLKKCIRSILRQSYKNFKLILVDDGSTDGSGRVCDSYKKKDTRVYVIHQKNKGSVEARKTGIYSEKAQASDYLMLCDADDSLPQNALQAMMTYAEKYQADCVCGRTKRILKGIPVPAFFTPPCFADGEVQIYDHNTIMKELYISCFGISNYPVSLWAKLYKKELLAEAADFESIVHFMGDDLSVTLRVMPNIKKLAIIPETVYYYRMGGGTSKYMPHMLEDFLALYRYKVQLMQQYNMNSDVKDLLDIELMNIVASFLQMCKYPGQLDEVELKQEIVKTISNEEIEKAASALYNRNVQNPWVTRILEKKYDEIEMLINSWYKQTKVKRVIKKLFGL